MTRTAALAQELVPATYSADATCSLEMSGITSRAEGQGRRHDMNMLYKSILPPAVVAGLNLSGASNAKAWGGSRWVFYVEWGLAGEGLGRQHDDHQHRDQYRRVRGRASSSWSLWPAGSQ